MMRNPSRKAPKQATNLSIDRDLLNEAREAGVSLSATLEEALRAKVAAARREKWKRENAKAIAEYNDLIAEIGIFSEGHRSF
jgi:antitoxin CcdA